MELTISAASLLPWQRLSCFGHNLHLAVTNGIKGDTRVTRALSVCCKIVTHFSHGFKKKRELAQILVSDCTARWGSMQLMIARMLEQEVAKT